VLKQRQIAPLLVLSMLSGLGCGDSNRSESPTSDVSRIAEVGTDKVGYFTFASDASKVLSQNFSTIQAKVDGKIMIGGDAGYPDVGDDFVRVMKKADTLGALKHVYLEGPGGPTGDSGIAGDECQRMMARAQKVNIRIDRRDCRNGSNWLKTWNSTGWWDSTVQEIDYFSSKYGVSSIEVDNLYRAGIESPASLLAFVKKFQAKVQEKQWNVSLLLKNLTVRDLALLQSDMEGNANGKVLSKTLTRFAISEEDFKSDWARIKAASLKIGITTLTSSNTDDYQARGYYGE
jgi:hypothetical protein